MSPEELRAWRKAERARLIEARMALPLDEHKAASEAITRTLAERFAPPALDSIGCYWPYRSEYNCIPLMKQVVARGGEVGLPVVIKFGQPLEFRPWTPTAKMEEGVWGILHPADGPVIWPKALLVPVVGFDAGGYRLGYGAGFYDRTLAVFPEKPLTIGVGFELSRMPTIHPQEHDIPLDYIVTEAGMFRPGR